MSYLITSISVIIAIILLFYILCHNWEKKDKSDYYRPF